MQPLHKRMNGQFKLRYGWARLGRTFSFSRYLILRYHVASRLSIGIEIGMSTFLDVDRCFDPSLTKGRRVVSFHISLMPLGGIAIAYYTKMLPADADLT